MRHKKLYTMLAIVLLTSMMLAACQTKGTEMPVAPAEAMEEPTEAMEEPTEAMEEPTEAMEEPTPGFSNEAYVPGGHWRQVLDVYLPPEGAGPYPTILAFHGGGFYARSKDHYAPYARHFTDQGYALVPANYRFAPADTYPAQVEDAFCALAWIHANASEFGFDNDRIFVMGDSAGGYLASMLGTVETPETYQGECPFEIQQSTSPLGVVVLYGFFDLTNLDGFDPDSVEASLEKFMGATVSEVPGERLAEMSAMSWIDGGEPPFLVIHGIEDEAIQSWVSEDFVNALEAAGVDATLVLVDDGHAFLLDRSSLSVLASLKEIDGFMRNLVVP
jgi:acetyl esterase/lipase